MTQSPDLQSQSFEDLRVELVHLYTLSIQNQKESDICMTELNAIKGRECDITERIRQARDKLVEMLHTEAWESWQVTITNGNELL